MGVYLKVHNTIYVIPDDVKYVEVAASQQIAYTAGYVPGTATTASNIMNASALVVRFWNTAKKLTGVSGTQLPTKEWIELV